MIVDGADQRDHRRDGALAVDLDVARHEVLAGAVDHAAVDAVVPCGDALVARQIADARHHRRGDPGRLERDHRDDQLRVHARGDLRERTAEAVAGGDDPVTAEARERGVDRTLVHRELRHADAGAVDVLAEILGALAVEAHLGAAERDHRRDRRARLGR